MQRLTDSKVLNCHVENVNFVYIVNPDRNAISYDSIRAKRQIPFQHQLFIRIKKIEPYQKTVFRM